MARPKISEFEKKLRGVISYNLKQLMHGMTQLELSDKSGVPASTISGYIAQRSLPTSRQVEKLARALCVRKADIDPRFCVEFTEATGSAAFSLQSAILERINQALTKMNADGQWRLAELADDLSEVKRYQRADSAQEAEEKR